MTAEDTGGGIQPTTRSLQAGRRVCIRVEKGYMYGKRERRRERGMIDGWRKKRKKEGREGEEERREEGEKEGRKEED